MGHTNNRFLFISLT